jgi:hypothetical protein
MPTPIDAGRPPALHDAAAFCREKWRCISFLSALLLVPCFWHGHLVAGDLGSHTYNAWLAQLISRGQAPGLSIVLQWTNVLFDICLYHAANWFGFAAAEKIVVAACVLVFFWGAFAFLAAGSGHAPWLLTPPLAMVAYGWTFQMGFFNYYISAGLAFFAIAILWRGRGRELLLALPLALLALAAHPIGFLWLICAAIYLRIAERLPSRARLALFFFALFGVLAVAVWLAYRYNAFRLVGTPGTFYNGADQLVLYANRYFTVFWLSLGLGVLGFVAYLWRGRGASSFHSVKNPLELWALLFAAGMTLPSSIQFGHYATEAGFLLARVTLLTAVAGIAVLACAKPRWWLCAGFSICAGLFFFFLYRDTGRLSALQSQANVLAQHLAPGHRVIGSIEAPEGSRVYYIGHIADRACVTRCIVYWNYEPPSRQFRIRVAPGSPINAATPGRPPIAKTGDFAIPRSLFPVAEMYLCGPGNLSQLCLREVPEPAPQSTSK